MFKQDPSSSASLDRLATRANSIVVVNELSSALANGDRQTQCALSESLTLTAKCFEPVVPTLLSWVVGSDERLQKCATDLLCSRTHWINPRDLDDFFIPAVVSAVPHFKDKWRGDLLMSAALSVAPELEPRSIASLAMAADLQFRNEEGNLLSHSASMGLLAERTPMERSLPVVNGIRLELREHRTALLHGTEDAVAKDPDKRWMFRVFINSLFAQRNVVGGRFASGKSIPWGEELMRECRDIIHTLRDLVEQEKYPVWAAEYQMLVTSAIVDPVCDPSSRGALKEMAEMLSDPLPTTSGILQRLLSRESFSPDLRGVLSDFDPGDIEQTIFFIAALMDTIVRLERGTSDVGEARALILYDELNSVTARVTDPLVAYFASELRRVLRRVWPDLFQYQGD